MPKDTSSETSDSDKTSKGSFAVGVTPHVRVGYAAATAAADVLTDAKLDAAVGVRALDVTISLLQRVRDDKRLKKTEDEDNADTD